MLTGDVQPASPVNRQEGLAMQLLAETRGDALVITALEDRIDAAGAIRFKERIRDAAAGGGARVVLDLSHVRFVDSSGLGAIVAVMKDLGPQRRLELAALSPNVQKVFRLTRMDSVFVIHAEAPAAVLRDAG
jgi:anti-sigma B factor antagonist